MKVALVFCGQGRSVVQASNSIKEKIIDVYNPDIFCHLWWDEHIEKSGYDGHNRHYAVSENLLNFISSFYKPKNFLFEPPITNWNSSELMNFNCPDHQTFLSQFYSIQKAFNLLEWSQYDFIIKMRYDLKVIKFPNLENLDKNIFYTGYDNGDFYYEDPIYFSDLCYILPNNLKQFTQIIDNINTFKILNDCVPEHVIKKTFRIFDLQSRMVRLSIDDFYCDVIR
jgi:hypothetical protein